MNIPDGWEELEVGETILKGNKFYMSGGWEFCIKSIGAPYKSGIRLDKNRVVIKPIDLSKKLRPISIYAEMTMRFEKIA